MIGLKFNIENKYDIILKKIFENIDLNNYKWHITEDEILTVKGDNLFSNQEYENNDFQKIITKLHYPIFLTLELWPKTSNITEIKDYADFMQDKCELILFITDTSYVEIYSKQEKILEAILRNVKRYDIKQSEIITNNDKKRKKFSAYFD